jgi:oxygen-dependent protoporphyrinogen oxidase
MFVTLREGLSTLVETIVGRLPAGSVRLNSRVERIGRSDRGWRLSFAAGESAEFDALILAAPSHVAASLLAPIDAALSTDLGQIEHSGTAIVSLGYDQTQFRRAVDGMGVCVPSVERSPILACSFSSQKYPHRAPEGKTLLRVFVGGARHPELAEMPDADLVPYVLKHLEPLLGIRGEPVFCDTAHWPRTMPQYHVGHCDRVARVEAAVGRLPGLQLAGNAYHGVGIPDCVHGGEVAADKVLGKHEK